MSLVEGLMTVFIMGVILSSIAELYVTSVRSYNRISFDTFAQQQAAVILGSIMADIQGAVRIIQPNTSARFPIPAAQLGGVRYVTFTQDPRPQAARFTYRFENGVIYFYNSDDVVNPPPLGARRRFVSDGRVTIDNFEVWATPVEVAMRIRLRDPTNADRLPVIQDTYVSLRYYN